MPSNSKQERSRPSVNTLPNEDLAQRYSCVVETKTCVEDVAKLKGYRSTEDCKKSCIDIDTHDSRLSSGVELIKNTFENMEKFRYHNGCLHLYISTTDLEPKRLTFICSFSMSATLETKKKVYTFEQDTGNSYCTFQIKVTEDLKEKKPQVVTEIDSLDASGMRSERDNCTIDETISFVKFMTVSAMKAHTAESCEVTLTDASDVNGVPLNIFNPIFFGEDYYDRRNIFSSDRSDELNRFVSIRFWTAIAHLPFKDLMQYMDRPSTDEELVSFVSEIFTKSIGEFCKMFAKVERVDQNDTIDPMEDDKQSADDEVSGSCMDDAPESEVFGNHKRHKYSTNTSTADGNIVSFKIPNLEYNEYEQTEKKAKHHIITPTTGDHVTSKPFSEHELGDKITVRQLFENFKEGKNVHKSWYEEAVKPYQIAIINISRVFNRIADSAYANKKIENKLKFINTSKRAKYDEGDGRFTDRSEWTQWDAKFEWQLERRVIEKLKGNIGFEIHVHASNVYKTTKKIFDYYYNKTLKPVSVDEDPRTTQKKSGARRVRRFYNLDNPQTAHQGTA